MKTTLAIILILSIIFSILGLLTSTILQSRYRQTLYNLNNITQEDEIVYNLVKNQYPSKTLYFAKLDYITETQYNVFIKVLIVENEVSNSIYSLIQIISAMIGIFSVIVLVCLVFSD